MRLHKTKRRASIVLAVSILSCISIAAPAHSAARTITDPDDTPSPLDVRSVRHFEKGERIFHVVEMYEPWDNSLFGQDFVTRERRAHFYLGLYLEPGWWYGWEYSIEVMAGDCLLVRSVGVEQPDCQLYASMEPGNEDHYDAPARKPKVWRSDDRTMVIALPRRWLNYYGETTSYFYTTATVFESPDSSECPPPKGYQSAICTDDAPNYGAVHHLTNK